MDIHTNTVPVMMQSLFLVLRLLLFTGVFYTLSGCRPAVDSFVEGKLAAETDAANKSAPKVIGNGVRVDSVSTKGKSIRYCYTLINYNKEDLNVAVFYKTTKDKLLQMANEDPKMSFYKKNRIRVAFVYYCKDGKSLSTIIIKPEDYTDSKD